MKGVLFCLGMMLTCARAAADAPTPPKKLLEDDNMDMLLKAGPHKPLKETKSFFEFKEAQIMAQKRMENDAPVPQEISDDLTSAPKAVRAHRKLRKAESTKFLPSKIKLSPDLDQLLPDANQLLSALKPVKARKLVQKHKRHATKSQTTATEAQPSAANDLKAFRSFNKEVKAVASLSNRQLLRNFRRNLSHQRNVAEMNYQNFLRFATDRYMAILADVYDKDQADYREMQARVTRNLHQSIQHGVRNHSRELDRQLQHRFTKLTKRKFHQLSQDIETMNVYYNRIYSEDQRMANKLMEVNQPVPADQKLWDSKDQTYLNSNWSPEVKY